MRGKEQLWFCRQPSVPEFDGGVVVGFQQRFQGLFAISWLKRGRDRSYDALFEKKFRYREHFKISRCLNKSK